jgi:hypothetical protein
VTDPPFESPASVLEAALADACSDLLREVHTVPLEHWTESVFRFFVVRQLLKRTPAPSCMTEWNRVDLLLREPGGAHLVEFKFFAAHPLLDHSGRMLRRKGGAGAKNFSEFNDTIEKLNRARSSRWASSCGPISRASLVLAYSDATALGSGRTYGSFYDSLTDDRITDVRVIVGEATTPDGHRFTCKLLTVATA